MPSYVALCTIDESKLDTFGKLRAQHYAFLIAEQQRILFGGPARTHEGGAPETMIIVMEAESLAVAQEWISREPYNQHGGFKSVVVRPWSQVLPETLEGSLRSTYESELAKQQP